jgi:hypothetical protein
MLTTNQKKRDKNSKFSFLKFKRTLGLQNLYSEMKRIEDDGYLTERVLLL